MVTGKLHSSPVISPQSSGSDLAATPNDP